MKYLSNSLNVNTWVRSIWAQSGVILFLFGSAGSSSGKPMAFGSSAAVAVPPGVFLPMDESAKPQAKRVGLLV